ncbi:MMPL family transporter [Ketobacter sp. MCCC 1A13808]|nr:MMPL family transporter [Ketobacter sp. MCCC 1A13808]
MILPLTVCVISTLWTLGLMALMDIRINIITSTIPVFLMTISIADSIHFMSDYYRNLEKMDAGAAVNHSMMRLTNPLMMTSVTTCMGFLALSYTKLIYVSQFGLFMSVGVAIAFVVTVTFLPAILPFLNVQRGKNTQHGGSGNSYLFRQFSRLLHWLNGKSVVFSVLILLLGAGMLVASRDVPVDNQNIAQFDKSTDIRKADVLLNQYFGGTVPNYFWIRGTESRAFVKPEAMAALDAIKQRLMSHKEIGYVASPSDFMKRMNQQINHDTFRLPPDPSEALYGQYLFLYENSTEQDVRNLLDPDYKNALIVAMSHTEKASDLRRIIQDVDAYAATVLPTNMKLVASGFGEVLVKSTDEIVNGQLRSFVLSALFVMVTLLLLFRSLPVALISVLPLSLTVLTNFSVIQLSGSYIDIGTALIAGIVFGIGVDFVIHLLSSVQGAIRAGAKPAEAVVLAVEEVWLPIMLNAISMAMGFLVLVYSNYGVTARLGMMVASSMMLCALFTLLVVPVLINLVKPKVLYQEAG